MRDIALGVFGLAILLTVSIPFFVLSDYRKEKRLYDSGIPCDGVKVSFISFRKYAFHHCFRNSIFLSSCYDRSFLDPFIKVILLCFAAVMVYGNIYLMSPRTQIGSIGEAENYSAKYVVEVSRNQTTFYKLPADIHREHEVSSSKYFIDKVYWPNGGWLYFGDDALLLPEKEYELEAQDGEAFYVTLTKECLSEENELNITPLHVAVWVISAYPIYQALLSFFILSKLKR